MMRKQAIALIVGILPMAGCGTAMSDRVTVENTGEVEFLNLRAGPGLGYSVILGLPDGTVLDRGDCVTELGQRWCRVSLAEDPGVSGYVSADYLSES